MARQLPYAPCLLQFLSGGSTPLTTGTVCARRLPFRRRRHSTGGAAWLFAAWLFMHQLLQWNCNEDHMACGEFDIAEFSYELFQLAKSGIMSPLEISVALMHALRLTRDRSWIMPTQCTTILAQILRMTSTTRSTWARREPLLFKLGDVSCAPSSIRKRQGLRICRSQGS